MLFVRSPLNDNAVDDFPLVYSVTFATTKMSENEDDYLDSADNSDDDDRSNKSPTLDTNANNESDDDEDEERSNDSGDEQRAPEILSTERNNRTGEHGNKMVVSLLPPDKLLKKTKKKAVRYMELKKSDRAIRELVRCTALVQIVHGDKHWKLAESHVKLATAYLDFKGYTAQAIYHVDIAESAVKSHLQPSNHEADGERIYAMFVEMYHTLGRACTAEKKLPEAEAALAKAEKMFEKFSKILSISHDDVEDWDIKLSLAMARLAYKQKKPAVAAMHFEKAMKLTISQQGGDCTDLINIYQSLGKVEQSKGEHSDHTKAIEFYLKAHSVATARYAEGSLEVADTSLALAQAYTKANDPYADNSAERYFGDSLSVYQETYGSSHEKTLAVQDEMAHLLIRTDRLEEGVTLLLSITSAKQERYGDFSPEVAETWKTIGSCYLSNGDVDRALRAMKKCLAAEVAVFGAKSRRTKETQKTVDMLLANPATSGKLKKSKADELKQRPRFSSVAKTAAQLGGFKSQMSFF